MPMTTNRQTVSMVRGEHRFVFRYKNTPLGRALLINSLWQKELEEPEWWTATDTALIANRTYELLERAGA